MIRVVAAVAAALSLALGAVACGGDEDEGGAAVPPSASLAPADAPVFGDAVVRPEGEQEEAVSEALSKLLNTDDPAGFLAEQLDNGLRDADLGITYSEDVEPWLGEHAGAFFTSFAGDSSGAFVVQVTDQGAAEDAVDQLDAAQGPSKERLYEGIEYRVQDAGSAVGFVDDFLVAGTEEGFRAAVDASRGQSLADDEAFRDELETAPGDSLATVYASGPAVLDQLVEDGEITEAERADAEQQGGGAAQQAAIASITAADDNIALQAAYGAGDTPEPEESPFLRELPADSWFAFGATGIGESLTRSFERFDASGFGSQRVDDALGTLLGADLEELTGWIGDAGGFASGTSIFGLSTALELETTDEQASTATLDTLERSLADISSIRIEPLSADQQGFTVSFSDAPVQIVVEQREGRVIAGLGEKSVDAVLEPTDTLGDSDPFGAATDALGSEYAANVFLDFEPVLELFESTGEGDDPEYQSAKPYLDHLDYLITGQRRQGDQNVVRAVLGLR